MTTHNLLDEPGTAFDDMAIDDPALRVSRQPARPPGWQRLFLVLTAVAVAHVCVMAWFAVTGTIPVEASESVEAHSAAPTIAHDGPVA